MHSCGMSTNIVQNAHKKCLELHNFVPIFFKNFSGGPPDPPPPLSHVFSKVFKKILKMLK